MTYSTFLSKISICLSHVRSNSYVLVVSLVLVFECLFCDVFRLGDIVIASNKQGEPITADDLVFWIFSRKQEWVRKVKRREFYHKWSTKWSTNHPVQWGDAIAGICTYNKQLKWFLHIVFSSNLTNMKKWTFIEVKKVKEKAGLWRHF